MLGNGASDTVFVGYGDNTIALGNGAGDVVNDSGNHNTITVGNGADTVYGGANDTITVGNGHDQLLRREATSGQLVAARTPSRSTQVSAQTHHGLQCLS